MATENSTARRPRFRRWWLLLLPGLLAFGPGPSDGQEPKKTTSPSWPPPTSLGDPRMTWIRRASVGWDMRTGPRRTVVDQVCLVPDFATFLVVISTWDQDHYFPVLFDDAETTLRFLRAFKPARVIRYPKAVPPIPIGDVWKKAVAAVGASWKPRAGLDGTSLSGDAVPKSLELTPPGVVLSSPDAPTLAASVTLSAGRFQPLLRLDSPKKFSDVFTIDEFNIFARKIEAKVNACVPDYGSLGDECDFLTLGGDWPYAYRDEKGELESTDDGVGRNPTTKVRWAYNGRLLGGTADSVYRSMCSLFLQPDAAVMLNSYTQDSAPWTDYSMNLAAGRFAGVLPTSHASGRKLASLEGWHELFDPINQSGLVIFNSQGSTNSFGLSEGVGTTVDVPRTVPTAVITIHSFSAASPNDPSTIAGRWLANGAFIYFGSMFEPYLQSFHTPRLVADMIAEGLPFVVATCSTNFEPFAKPWRLVYIGDPLYQLRPKGRTDRRLDQWQPTASWLAYAEEARPEPSTDEGLTRWALKAALTRSQAGRSKPADDLVAALLEVRRGRLTGSFRLIYDALLVDVLLGDNRRSDFRSKLATFPEAERSSVLRRANDSVVTTDFHLAFARGDLEKLKAVWVDMMRLDAPVVFKEQATAIIRNLSDTPVRRRDFALMLRAALKSLPGKENAKVIEEELERAEKAMKANP